MAATPARVQKRLFAFSFASSSGVIGLGAFAVESRGLSNPSPPPRARDGAREKRGGRHVKRVRESERDGREDDGERRRRGAKGSDGLRERARARRSRAPRGRRNPDDGDDATNRSHRVEPVSDKTEEHERRREEEPPRRAIAPDRARGAQEGVAQVHV